MNVRPEASYEEAKSMETDSVDSAPPPDPETQYALIRAQEKEIACKEARLSYLSNIILIECKDARDTSTPTVNNIEKEKQDITTALQSLQGELSILIPCHVPDCDHNLKIKNLAKRKAETYIQPPKFIPNGEEFPALPGTSQVTNSSQKPNLKSKAPVSDDGFGSPTKYAKKPKIDDGLTTSTAIQNKFSALAGAKSTDLDQTSMLVADKIPPYGSFTRQILI
ncbi:hypothetical protein TNCT_707261 [Trichonephila clavata]|uniref:Uncharacterized protein n=1 Tax=Trichonephila clavata TaxID=2740835 RepID=A0A8X6M5H9_TRICU|nr:hypothetical protein TNCT_707261 [Trichonephila clavata]